MSTPVTLAAYALVLLAVFAAALGIGSVVGPVGTAGVPADSGTHSTGGADGATHSPGPAEHEEDR
jgi:hypothetical protein